MTHVFRENFVESYRKYLFEEDVGSSGQLSTISSKEENPHGVYLLLQTVHVTINFPQLLKSDECDDGGRRSANQSRC
jgi:hypothetical protein